MRIRFLILLGVFLIIPIGMVHAFPVEQEYTAGLQRRLQEFRGECRYDYALLDNCFLWLEPDEFLDWQKMLESDFSSARRLNFAPFHYPSWMSLTYDMIQNDRFFTSSKLFSNDKFSINTEMIFGKPAPFQGSSTTLLRFDPVSSTVQEQIKSFWSELRSDSYVPLTPDRIFTANPALTGKNVLPPPIITEESDYQPGGFVRLQTVIYLGVPALLLLGGLFRIIRLPNALLMIICWFALFELYKILRFVFTGLFD